MSLLSLIRIVLGALGRNFMRSVLIALSVAIGVALVVTVVAIGDGARKAVEKAAESMGTNVFMVWPTATMFGGVRTGAGSQATLTLDDARAAREEIDIVSSCSATVRLGGSQCINGNKNWNSTVNGVEATFTDVRQWPAAEGKFFTDLDVQQVRNVCVLGKRVADELFSVEDAADDSGRRPGAPMRIRENPIGVMIKIRGTPMKVIGVAASKGQSAMGYDQDDVIFVPISTAMRRMGAVVSSSNVNAVGSIVLSARSAELVDPAMEAVKDLLSRRHKNAPGSEDFMVRNFSDMARAAADQQRILAWLLATVAGVSLVVGGLGIMNIMLVSVTERTREIGIRMAVGAHGRHILAQFLLEALTISTLGGFAGIGIAYLSAFAISEWMGWTAPVSPQAVAIAVGVSIGIGAFFGLWPALKAASLDPIEALRFE
ncbi:MAG: ABC transporter permease [Planctomycetes bacterium]|nr:ABC transporter permease [Planctomycetota bacterium]